MTVTSLLVPRQTPVPSPNAWFPSGLGIAAGVAGNTAGSSYYNDKTYIGLVDGDGNARVASYTHSTKTWTLSPAIVTGLGIDTHAGPSVLVRSSDHKLLLAVASHDGVHIYVAVSTNAEDVSAWGAASDISSTLGGTSYTYANLFQLSGESGKIYLFYRDEQDSVTSGVLCFSTSTNAGSTWAAQTVLYKNTNKQCYWAVSSDDTSRIDFVVSDGNVIDNAIGSVYHFYYSGGSRFKSDGTTISASLPLAPSNITKIYDGATNGYTRAPYDVVTNGGNPCAVWAVYDPAGSGSNEHYWYGSCSAGTWTVNEITNTGSTPDANFQEGGCAIDTTNASRVFVSKKTSSVWQMFKYETGNSGSTWTNTQLSSDSNGQPTDAYNLRPRSPRDAVSALSALWCFGPHWSFSSAEPPAAQLRAYPNPVGAF